MADSDYTYEIVLYDAHEFKYTAYLYYRGKQVAAKYTDTKWGARRALKKEKRRHYMQKHAIGNGVIERGEL